MTSQSRDDVIKTRFWRFCVFKSRLTVFYKTQEAKNWHEDTSRYGGCRVADFKKIWSHKPPEKPQKHPKNTPKIKQYDICVLLKPIKHILH